VTGPPRPAGRRIPLIDVDLDNWRSEVTHERVVVGGAVVVVLALLAVLAARSCSSPDTSSSAPPATGPPATEAPTTTAAPVIPPLWPLTGMLADPAQVPNAALAVKVDNSPQARPHAGLNQADLVYELQVEGITRFMEVYHSQVPDRVGPVRSARSSDLDLLWNLGRPLFMWSGANGGVIGEVHGTGDLGGLIDAGAASAAGGHYYRDRGRAAPHNLYANALGIRDQLGPQSVGGPGAPLPHAPAGTVPPGAAPAAGVRINFGLGVVVEYVWDAERHGWDRFQVDQSHGRANSAFVDEGRVQVAPENVVILFLDYFPDPIESKSPKATSVGEGDGLVLTAGTSVAVHWKREANIYGWHLTNAMSGEPVMLGAGRAWVALPATGQGDAAIIDPGEAAGLLGLRA
jgi:hypothetical protein